MFLQDYKLKEYLRLIIMRLNQWLLEILSIKKIRNEYSFYNFIKFLNRYVLCALINEAKQICTLIFF